MSVILDGKKLDRWIVRERERERQADRVPGRGQKVTL